MQKIAGRKTVNYHESEIEFLFEAVFALFNWTPELVKRMQQILRSEYAEKSCDHKTQVAALRHRYEMLQTYMDKAYDDKLAGDERRIGPEVDSSVSDFITFVRFIQ